MEKYQLSEAVSCTPLKISNMCIKDSRLYNNAGVSKPEVSPRNTRREKAQQILTV